MKKIVPFNNVLTFKTDVCDITSISLEHKINIDKDLISGVFYITGEYKMTDGQLERNSFNFELPFDIALSTNYIMDKLVVDIDDFRYELIDNNKVKVNIDLFIDGEEEPIDYSSQIIDAISNLDTRMDRVVVTEDTLDKEDNLIEENTNANEEVIIPYNDKDEIVIENNITNINENNPVIEEEYKEKREDDLLSEMLEKKENKVEKEEVIVNNEVEVGNNTEVNIFNNINTEDKYVTYRVYRVVEGDTIDTILNKYNITKEELTSYNEIENINCGDKLIIPYHEK